MSRPGFVEGVAFALGAGIAGALANAVLTPLVGAPAALRIAVAGVGLGYLAYLLARAEAGSGRICVLALWAAGTGAALAFGAPLAVHAAVPLALAWLVRAVWFHRSPLPSLADLGIAAAGLAVAAACAARGAGLGLTVWSVLLVQAAFVLVPPLGAPAPRARRAARDRFEGAHRAAERALGRLAGDATAGPPRR